MNFLDPYDVPAQSATPQQSEQSLNEEVSEVIGQLGRFWAFYRSLQSQSVLETARKDLSEVVTQAQKELTKLTSEPAAQPVASTSAPSPENPEPPLDAEDEPPIPTPDDTPVASTSASSIFSRLQSALPPNLLETARNQIPESLKHASDNIDIPQIRANFLAEFQRVQGVTLAQAEEYAHKSEALIRDAVKEASEVLRDAVKILPPEESGSQGGLVWDGSDMWSLPLELSETTASSNLSKTQRRADAQNAVATRAESLFRRLRHDPVILERDPAVDGGELYSSWVASEITSQEGGITGKYWSERIATLLGEASTGETLKVTRDTLVPSNLTEDDFWTRYFFRAHQIEAEEQKRKTLLEGEQNSSIDSGTLEEDDFSWEDDDEEAGVTEALSTSAGTVAPLAETLAAGETPDKTERTSESLSATSSSVAQDSSEEYDVVSSGNVSPKVEHKPVITRPDESKDSSDGDSDWE
ncbi:hypothetical protein DXG01_013639 [Tephrocybe rancida]|nr:hypothetical protein DXG01_013639 [Tephrocybe rancida]